MGFVSKATEALGGLLGAPKQDWKKNVLAAIEPVKPMPIPDTSAANKARRRSLLSQLARQGRQSTILSDEVASSDTLG